MNDSFQPTPAHVRQGPDIEAGRQVLRESALEWFEREDGLPVVGFRIDSPTGLANDPAAYAAWLETVRPKYGGWTGIFDALGFFSIFNSAFKTSSFCSAFSPSV